MSKDDTLESIARLETNQENLTSSVQKLSDNINRFVESNYRLESKIDSLEIKALNRLDVAEARINETQSGLEKVKTEIYDIQIEKANELGQKTANEKVKTILWNNWFKLLTVIVIIIPVVVSVYNLTSQDKLKQEETKKEVK